MTVVISVLSFVFGAAIVWAVYAIRSRDALKAAQQAINGQAEACQQAEARATGAEARATTAETRANEAETRANELDKSLQAAKQEAEGALGTKQQLQGQLAQKEQAARDAQAKATECTGELERARGVADEATKRATAADKGLAEHKRDVSRLNDQLGQTQGALDAQKQRAQSLQASLDEAQQQAETAPAPASGGGTTVLDVLDTDPNLHAAARETIRMLYDRFTKSKAVGKK